MKHSTIKNNFIKTRVLFLILSIFLSSHAIAFMADKVPSGKMPFREVTLREPSLKSKNYLLMDYDSGKLLVEKNIDEKIEPASLTKMMTMYVIDQEIKNGTLNLDDKILISKKAWKAEGSRMFLEVGSKITVREIIKGIIISSANDGCIAMAEHIAGSEESFADIMNTHASLLGMNNTNFNNATGLPHKNHYTTARDMATLARSLIKDFPESYSLYSEKIHSHLDIKQYNRNRLLWRNNLVDGIKTGHTESAGYCLAASAKKDDMRLISLVMGAKTDEVRTSESNKLLTWGFRFFETHKVYGKGKEFDNINIWMGNSKTLAVGLNEDLYITIRKGIYNDLDAAINAEDIIKAPVKKGDIVGTFTIKHKDKVLIEKPIVALEDVQAGGMFKRASDYMSLTFKSLLKKINL